MPATGIPWRAAISDGAGAAGRAGLLKGRLVADGKEGEMFRQNGEAFFVVDTHAHFWDGSLENILTRCGRRWSAQCPGLPADSAWPDDPAAGSRAGGDRVLDVVSGRD